MIGDHIGRSLRRLEDTRFLTGQGRCVDDTAVPGQLHGVVLRSPHGHAFRTELAELLQRDATLCVQQWQRCGHRQGPRQCLGGR